MNLLKDKELKGYNAVAFCKKHGISKQTFYNWQQKYGSQKVAVNDFIPLKASNIFDKEPVPFCEISTPGKTKVRFFEPVDAGFIKSLIS